MKVNVKISGFETLKKVIEKKSKTIDSATKTVVAKYTADLKRQVLTNTLPGGRPKVEGLTPTRPGKIFVKGYSDANIHDSITDEVRDTGDGYEGKVMSNQEHAATMEFGGRYVQPEPWMKPAVDLIEPKFIEALEKLAK